MSSRKQQKAANRREQLAAEHAAQRRRNRHLRLSVGMVLAVVLAVGTVVGVTAFGRDDVPASAADSRLVRADSHRLQQAPDGSVTLVEFLDFECPTCGALYPSVERLRDEYRGRVTFVTRYFPLPMHVNGERAARAAEAAAEQGKYQAMYAKLFASQQEWAGRKVPADDIFRRYADGLGLDLKRYDADYRSEATAKRVRKDVADGEALGVQATPTFFVDGEKTDALTEQDLRRQLDAALR